VNITSEGGSATGIDPGFRRSGEPESPETYWPGNRVEVRKRKKRSCSSAHRHARSSSRISSRPNYHARLSGLDRIYAARVAAAELCARPGEKTALIAALMLERAAAKAALWEELRSEGLAARLQARRGRGEKQRGRREAVHVSVSFILRLQPALGRSAAFFRRPRRPVGRRRDFHRLWPFLR